MSAIASSFEEIFLFSALRKTGGPIVGWHYEEASSDEPLSLLAGQLAGLAETGARTPCVSGKRDRDVTPRTAGRMSGFSSDCAHNV